MAATAEPPRPAPAPQAPRLERVRRLGRAAAQVRAAEEQLEAAKARRVALELEEPEQSVCQTYTGDEWLAHNRGGMPPGRDTAEIVSRIQVEHEAERRQAG